MSIDDKLRNIELDLDISFTNALSIFQDFISSNKIMDFQVYNLLDIWSAKINKLNKYNKYPHESIFMLLYVTIMLYNDLANPDIKNKIKLKSFIKMTNGLNNNNNFPEDFITEIYNDIYDKIKEENIENNILDYKKFEQSNKKTCIIL